MDEIRKPRVGVVVKTLAIIALAGVSFSLGAAFAGAKAGVAHLTQAVADAGQIVDTTATQPTDVNTPVDFQEFWDLWQQLKARYYLQPVDEKKMFYGAMQGMASSLGDPYTVFFEPTSATQFSQDLAGQFDGIGAEIGIKNDQLEIIAPLAGLPADKAGLLAGDMILEINATDTTAMPVDQAVDMIRGPKGTPVTLLIGRNVTAKDATGKEKTSLVTKQYTIIRDTIVVKSVNTTWPSKTVADIQITSFDKDTGSLFQQAVTDALAKNPKSIILDLRNDPGGYLDQATTVAGEWVGSQTVVSERRQGQIVETLPGTGSGRLKSIPTIVLVNQGSASASEIVAGALHDYGIAKLVGMKTFGKGSVQDYSNFPDGSAIKVTIAEWLTPKGNSINKVGIPPDVQVDLTQDDINANKDPQLDKALQLLGAKPATPAAKPAPAQAPTVRTPSK